MTGEGKGIEGYEYDLKQYWGLWPDCFKTKEVVVLIRFPVFQIPQIFQNISLYVTVTHQPQNALFRGCGIWLSITFKRRGHLKLNNP